MKRLILTGMLCGAMWQLSAREGDIATALQCIEQNNTTLRALRSGSDAQKLNNLSGISLPDPEVEVGYLWGDPKEIGPRQNYAVKQSLDLTVIGGSRLRLAKGQNELVETRYAEDRMSLLSGAEQLCNNIVYYNRRVRLLQERTETATRVNDLYTKSLQLGNVSRAEANKVALNLVKYRGELERAEIERQTLLTQLAALNGGEPLALTTEAYGDKALPTDFEAWFEGVAERQPALLAARRQSDVERLNVKQTRGESLPTLTIGYAQEDVPEQSFKGVTVGLNIPLWSRKNKVKTAKTAYLTAQLDEEDTRIRLHAQLSGLHRRAESLLRTTDYYRRALTDADNTERLLKALHAGEISLLDFLKEMETYYETVDMKEQSELEYAQAVSELLAVEL